MLKTAPGFYPEANKSFSVKMGNVKRISKTQNCCRQVILTITSSMWNRKLMFLFPQKLILVIFCVIFVSFQVTPEALAEPPSIALCQVFPAENPWNRDISNDPVDPNSSKYIESIGKEKRLHPDFGFDPDQPSTLYGIPYTVVDKTQAKVPIQFVSDYGVEESNPGPYPIPPNAPVEGGNDRHVLVLEKDNCKLYELYNAQRQPDNSWNADSGAVFDLKSNNPRPNSDFCTSADAAGLPILPGLVRYSEVASGEIRHALRFTTKKTQRAFIRPATHYASNSTDPNLPPMGLRLRLKANFNTSNYKGNARVILNALKKYGLILADNGQDWFITGAQDSRWNNDDLAQLKKVPGSAFEVVSSGKLVFPPGDCKLNK
jgi:hypothetical protein